MSLYLAHRPRFPSASRFVPSAKSNRLNCRQLRQSSVCRASATRVSDIMSKAQGKVAMTFLQLIVTMASGLDMQCSQAAAVLAEAKELPEMVVFDLDYTLWPFWCEMYTTRDEPKLFPEARGVVDALKEKGVPMALASRTPTPDVARAFLKKLGWSTGVFDTQQLIPASSGFDHSSNQKDQKHFPAIQKETGVAYNRMLFYDDEGMNVKRVSKLGVASILVDTSEGVSVRTLKQGLDLYNKQYKN